MTMAQLDALMSIEKKRQSSSSNGRDSRQWGSTADLLAFASR